MQLPYELEKAIEELIAEVEDEDNIDYSGLMDAAINLKEVYHGSMK